MNNAIQHNSDFLFLYEASQCNPNGDPDQENKPRMDYDTHTNLVTDVRVKRYIRDYLKQQGKDIFVDMEGDSKVTMDDKLKGILSRAFSNDDHVRWLLNNEDLFQQYLGLKEDSIEKTVGKFVNKKPANKELNIALLTGLVKNQFTDIRMFGSAFAIDGFNKSMTGPIQLNWGYSLNQVFLMDSNTIASIMNDDNSTFGKDYRVKYSLLAFHGTINKYAAQTTGLTVDDQILFRKALWESITATPTRSKLNQYPKFYLEILYKEGHNNGYFGDLRNWVDVTVKNGDDPRTVRSSADLHISFERLKNTIESHRGHESDKPVHEVLIRTSPDLSY